MKHLNILILFLSLAVLSCVDKKENQEHKSTTQVVSPELKQEIESIEAVTQEIKNTKESIDASIKKTG